MQISLCLLALQSSLSSTWANSLNLRLLPEMKFKLGSLYPSIYDICCVLFPVVTEVSETGERRKKFLFLALVTLAVPLPSEKILSEHA